MEFKYKFEKRAYWDKRGFGPNRIGFIRPSALHVVLLLISKSGTETDVFCSWQISRVYFLKVVIKGHDIKKSQMEALWHTQN